RLPLLPTLPTRRSADLEDDPQAPATTVDDGTEKPEPDEEDDDRNPEGPGHQRCESGFADVLAGDVTGECAEPEPRTEVQDCEGRSEEHTSELQSRENLV